MSDFSIKTHASAGSDQRWLRSKDGVDNAIPAAIDVSLLTAGTHYDTNGVIPSGLALGKKTGEETYGPFDPSATDGRQYLAGFLLESEQLEATFTQITTQVLNVALLVRGIIDPRFVPNTPTLNNLTPGGEHFVFVGVDYVKAGA